MRWSKAHTFGVVVISLAVLGVGAISVYRTFGDPGKWGIWSFLILAGLLVALLAVVGLGLAHRVDGALMDSRFRISLAQFQLAVWTVVVLGAWGAAVFANLGANKGSDAFNVSIPSELWLALGISATSLGGSKLIQRQAGGSDPPEVITPAGKPTAAGLLSKRGETPAEWSARGNLLAHTSPEHASWGDLFAADSVDSGAVPDISKIQMFFFTIVLAFGYAIACVDLFATSKLPISGLPEVNESFAILLGISQGTYLAKKSVETVKT
jgi:hypothetical protein